MTCFFALCYQRGPGWVPGKPVFEQPLHAHRLYMRQLFEAGTLRLGGPFLDDTGGLVIVQAADEGAARELLDRDPAISAGVMRATLHSWQVLAGAEVLAAIPAPISSMASAARPSCAQPEASADLDRRS
jgi:uncharacterized protein YciI